MSMLRGAIVNEQGREQLRDFIHPRWLMTRATIWGPMPRFCAGSAASLLVGVVTGSENHWRTNARFGGPRGSFGRQAPDIQQDRVPHGDWNLKRARDRVSIGSACAP